MSGAKFETYEPGTLNCDGSFEPSPPKTFAFLPCSISCWAKFCASPGFCVGKNTKSALLGTFVTNDEKSVVVLLTDRRVVVTPFAFRTASAASARPCEYGSWKSNEDDVLGTLADHEVRVRGALDVVARDDAEERRRGLLRGALRQRRARRRRRDVRDARPRSRRLARSRDGARRRRADHRDDGLVGDELLRQRLGRCRALLDGRVTRDERDLEAVLGGERLDRVLRPAQLLVAEEACAAGERGDHGDLQRAACS